MSLSLGIPSNCSIKNDSAQIKGKITYNCSFGDVHKVVSLALKEQLSNVLKAVRYTLFFAGQSMEKAPASFTEIGKQFGNFKNVISIGNLNDKIPKACGSLYKSVVERSWKTSGTALLDCGFCFNSIADAAEVTTAYFPSVIPLTLGTLVKNTNVVVTGVCASLSSALEIYALSKASEMMDEQQILSLLKLAVNVSYVAFAAISLGCMAMGIVPATTTIVTCLASGTVFGLLSFFYERFNDPYGKYYEEHKKSEKWVQLAS